MMDDRFLLLIRKFRAENECSTDRLICNPVLRYRFLDLVGVPTGGSEEYTALWGVVSARKSRLLSMKKVA